MIKRSLILLLLVSNFLVAQKNQYNVYAMGFYNLENLFDTVDDPENHGDNEFLPESSHNWTLSKYHKKLDNIAKVISKLGKEYCPAGISALGVAEVENRKVLEDLVKRPAIKDLGLQIVHDDSPDWRGIDVGLIYNPKMFKVLTYKWVEFEAPKGFKNKNFKTRNQLLVSGLIAGEKVHIIVNHWPSRYGSKSSSLREAAAVVTKKIINQLYKEDPNAKVIVTGDLNDNPTNNSCKVVLDAKLNKKDVKKGSMFNPTWKLYDKGIGTLGYQGKWHLFDQVILTPSWIQKAGNTLKFWKIDIFNRDFMIQKSGKHKGYPFRTFSGSAFMNGYSDHFPVVMYMIKKQK